VIQRDHMDAKGWGDIGYHFRIDPSGRVLEGRELLWQMPTLPTLFAPRSIASTGSCSSCSASSSSRA